MGLGSECNDHSLCIAAHVGFALCFLWTYAQPQRQVNIHWILSLPTSTLTAVRLFFCWPDGLELACHVCHMGSHSVTCHLAKISFPPFPQPKIVLDLATLEGCKAELTKLASCIPIWYTRPKTVTHPSTNWARPTVTSLIHPTVLLLCHKDIWNVDCRHELGKWFFQRIIKDKLNVLFYLLPAKCDVQLTTRLRCARQYPIIFARTNRYKNSFILFGLNHLQWCHFVYAWFSCMFLFNPAFWCCQNPVNGLWTLPVVIFRASVEGCNRFVTRFQ